MVDEEHGWRRQQPWGWVAVIASIVIGLATTTVSGLGLYQAHQNSNALERADQISDLQDRRVDAYTNMTATLLSYFSASRELSGFVYYAPSGIIPDDQLDRLYALRTTVLNLVGEIDKGEAATALVGQKDSFGLLLSTHRWVSRTLYRADLMVFAVVDASIGAVPYDLVDQYQADLGELYKSIWCLTYRYSDELGLNLAPLVVLPPLPVGSTDDADANDQQTISCPYPDPPPL